MNIWGSGILRSSDWATNRGKRFSCPPWRPDRLLVHPSLLWNGYQGKVTECLKLTTHLHLDQRLRMSGNIPRTSSPPHVFMAELLVKRKDNFTFAVAMQSSRSEYITNQWYWWYNIYFLFKARLNHLLSTYRYLGVTWRLLGLFLVPGVALASPVSLSYS
jgi:hypothetical protein